MSVWESERREGMAALGIVVLESLRGADEGVAAVGGGYCGDEIV